MIQETDRAFMEKVCSKMIHEELLKNAVWDENAVKEFFANLVNSFVYKNLQKSEVFRHRSSICFSTSFSKENIDNKDFLLP
jgi:hypothetical protein